MASSYAKSYMGLCAISRHVHCNLRRSNPVVVQSINPYWFMGMRDHFSSLNSLTSMVGGAGCSPSYWLVEGRAKRPFVGRGWRRYHRRGSGDGSVLSTLFNVVDRTCLKPREAVGNHNGASIRAGIRGSADSPLPPSLTPPHQPHNPILRFYLSAGELSFQETMRARFLNNCRSGRCI